MRKALKKILFPFLKYGFEKYHNKPRKYRYEGIEVVVNPEVFPPHYTISTKLILEYLKPIDLKDKTVLELGCGSGIIALFASSKNAKVTASDINEVATSALEKAALKNNIKLEIVNSNLFDNIQNTNFDYILINPPYYPENPKNDKERAWFCGENFEYFEKLYNQLPGYLAPQTWMILSEDCDIERIKQIAVKNNLTMKCIFKKRIKGEKNYIFNIRSYEK